ncbi:MAG: sulfatase-like hydrolase/transferase [Saprospiraceae bacterium]|nr:sulfatase-like hydrolase/transferase [Saprospiraceae bacterium]
MLKNHTKYFSLVLSLTVLFWITSAIGLVYVRSRGVDIPNLPVALFHSLINNFLAAFFMGLIAFGPYILVDRFKRGWGLTFAKCLFGLTILIEVALVKYFSETFLLLGSDLLGYSISDSVATVKSLEDLSVWYLVPVIVVLGFFIGLHMFFAKFLTNKYVSSSLLAVLGLCLTYKLAFTQELSDSVRNKIEYLVSDIGRSKLGHEVEVSDEYLAENGYPFLRSGSGEDVLGPFFRRANKTPNIVFIIGEGLGSDFMGHGAQFGGFTPFLDSLSLQSLTWENFVCNSGRSFGAMPSIFGSLPFGADGFMELLDPPTHLSILSILKANNYEVSYYDGSQSAFDRKINFLENAGVENIVDMANFGPGFEKIPENAAGFSWGYPDAELFRKVLSSLDDRDGPRLDMIFTVSGHEPFVFPNSGKYEAMVDQMLPKLGWSESKISVLQSNKSVFSSLLYTDESIKNFINQYKQREDFDNTIFIITGDHRLIPIPHKDAICRFHVPFMIYSPLVKQPRTFAAISSHLDVAPSLIAFLANNYNINPPQATSWLGEGIDTTEDFAGNRQIPFMKFKGSVNDYLYNEYFVNHQDLYKIGRNLTLTSITDKMVLDSVLMAINKFRELNNYVTLNNRIYPASVMDQNFFQKEKVTFSEEELALIEKMIEGLNNEEIFIKARDLAWNSERVPARLLCDHLLRLNPNHSDARTLKARTLAWDGDYVTSETEFLDVIRRNPVYDDPYLGIMDLYWWSDQDQKAITMGEKAQKSGVVNPEIQFKLAKAFQRLNKVDTALQMIDSLIALYPDNSDYLSLKGSLEQFN